MSEMPESQFESNYPRLSAGQYTPETEALLRDFWGTVGLYAIASLVCTGLAWLAMHSRFKQVVKSRAYAQIFRAHAAYVTTLAVIGGGLVILALVLYFLRELPGAAETSLIVLVIQYCLSFFTIYRAFKMRSNPYAIGESALVRYSLRRHGLERQD